MSTALLEVSLAGLAARRRQALLVALAVACATAMAAIAVSVGRLADDPWQRTFAATHGAHVVIMAPPGADLAGVAGLPGVAEASGPYAVTFTALLRPGRREAPVRLQAAPADRPAVDRPTLVSGGWARPGTVVLERSLAAELGLRTGARIALRGPHGRVAARVAGIAVTASQPVAFPSAQPGLVFAARDVFRAAAADAGATVALRLDRPDQAEAFAAQAAARLAGPAAISTWTQMRADARADTRTNQVVLSFFTTFLLLIAGSVVAVLVGAQVLRRARTVAVLTAIGATPRQIAAALAVEQAAIAAIAAVAGAAAGALLAPRFVAPSAALLGAGPGGIAWSALAALVGAVVLGVAVVAAVAALRAGRGAVASGLGALSRGRARPSGVAAGLERAGAPAALALGARDAFAPRGRALLGALAIALTVATGVAALSMEATLDASARAEATQPAGPPPGGGPRLQPYPTEPAAARSAERLRTVVYGLSAALLLVGAVNLLATALLSVSERIRDIGLIRALGAGSRQVAGLVLGSEALRALVAAVAGLPLGLLAFRVAYVADNGSASGLGAPAVWQLAAAVPLAVLVAVAVCSPAALTAARVEPANALRAVRE